MKKLKYKLNNENYKELNSYMALHDKSVKKKMITLMSAIAMLGIIPVIVFVGVNWTSILIGLAIVVLIVLFFPRIFWSIVFSRIDRIVDENKIDYPELSVNIGDEITIMGVKETIRIKYSEIKNMDFTKSNCMLFYEKDNKINTLVIPNNIFTDEELSSFVIDMEGRIKNGQK